jgi:hypothetical protein
MATLLDQWRLLQRVLVDKRLSKGDAAVAGALLDFATDDGGAYPSIDTLAERAGMHRASAIRSAARLVELQYFTRQQGGGRRNTTVYRPNYDAETVAPLRPFESENSRSGATETAPETVAPALPFQPETVASVHQNSRTGAHKQSHPCDPNPPMNPPMNPPKRDSLSASFADWWSVYPRRVAKGKAWTAYQKAAKTTQPDALLAGARRYAAEREGQDPQFTKHPATWLNGACWLDEPTQAQAQARPQGSRGGGLAAAMALHAGLIDEAERGADD